METIENTAVLQLNNVTKKIGRKTIIDNISFEVPRGEVFGFLGPNGAGKTTTIRMMVGLMSITEGEILINGVNVAQNFEKAMNYVGAIVENPELYKFLTGYQNLLHYARMIPGLTKQRIDEVIQLVGLQNRIKDKVKTYSLGMRQRLGIAQALLHKPLLLILDEPTNGLDPAGIRELRDHLKHLTRAEGISVIVSSHLLAEMELMCDRIAIIQNGKIVGVQTLQDMVHDDVDLSTVFYKVNEPARAQEVVANYLNDALALNVIVEDGLHIGILPERIAEFNAVLVQAGIAVSGIMVVSQTLEDRFLEMTRGEDIV